MKGILTTYRLLGVMMLGLSVTCTALAAQMVSVGGSNVNMRAEPSTKSEILWQLERGYPLKVLKRRASWLKVRDFEGDVGWVSLRLTSKTPYLIVKSDRANIRSGPSTRYRIVGKAVYGDLLRMSEKRGKWIRVAVPRKGTMGWVARSLVWGW